MLGRDLLRPSSSNAADGILASPSTTAVPGTPNDVGDLREYLMDAIIT